MDLVPTPPSPSSCSEWEKRCGEEFGSTAFKCLTPWKCVAGAPGTTCDLSGNVGILLLEKGFRNRSKMPNGEHKNVRVMFWGQWLWTLYESKVSRSRPACLWVLYFILWYLIWLERSQRNSLVGVSLHCISRIMLSDYSSNCMAVLHWSRSHMDISVQHHRRWTHGIYASLLLFTNCPAPISQSWMPCAYPKGSRQK